MLKQFVAAAACVATAALASTAGQAGQAKDEAKDQRVCRTYPVTGSLARRERVCATREEWDKAGQGTRDQLGREVGRISGGTPKI